VDAAVRASHPGGVDALLDLASRSPEELNAYASVVRDGGRAVSSVGAAGEGPGRVNVGALTTQHSQGKIALSLS
jgi:NADPH:quinone reductase